MLQNSRVKFGIPSSLEDLSLFLLRSSTAWMRPTHIMECNWLYSKSTDLNCYLILKTSSQQHLDF